MAPPKDLPIRISHINIRTSIWLMLARILLLECILGSLIVILEVPLIPEPIIQLFGAMYEPTVVLLLLLWVKLVLTTYVILQWVNEYYEIRPERVMYKSGIFFKQEKHYVLSKVSSVGMNQPFFGKICNFGTISLFDRDLREYKYLVNVHNPERYFKVIEKLLPPSDEDKKTIRTRLRDTIDKDL